MILTATAHAKINWSLNILGVLSNGYHDLDMLMQPISLSDALIFESRPGGASERIYRKMLNSRVWRLNSDGEEAMNWFVRFLTCENWLDCEPEKREKFV